MNNLNPLLEISQEFLSKGITNGLHNRGDLIDYLGNTYYKRFVPKIVSKTESQLRRIYKRLLKQNGGDINKTQKDWKKIFWNINYDRDGYHVWNSLSPTRAKTRKRILDNIMNPIEDLERRTL